ncbi:hypothetical protein QBZ16_002559 [Prototheca wickerhamii]|uniref:ABC transporter domain-containing protein n=1 Tax=Prototheca wickerhamii TaxID=3111 RepID=A0AAD9MHP0_PROWI|nr:hypothetical protein QBZ16_002559 [Prototheca wickerhamii]
MGQVLADTGEVHRARGNSRVALLSQEFGVKPENTLRKELSSGFASVVQAMKRQQEIEHELESVGDDLDRMGELLDELTALAAATSDLELDTMGRKIEQMATQLGFEMEDLDRLVASFSGGWQMRIGLGKALLQEPDVLLLDEPTNHLDVAAIAWLESNYTAYLSQKVESVAQHWEAHEKQQREISRQKDLIARLGAGAQSGRASAAAKVLQHLQKFLFPQVDHMGQTAVEIKGLRHGYSSTPLFDNLNLTIGRGERLALVGPNGAGKSTLLRLVMGREEAQEGVVTLGKHSVVPNYYEQNQAEALDPDLTIMQTVERANPDARMDDIKALLGRMMFSGPAVEKKVECLSGGEKARLALAVFMLTKGTLLVLDEPTNHLDILSKEMLEEALQSFQGDAVIVSHDRYFLRRVATRVATIKDGVVTDYQGDYEYFLSKNAEEAAIMEGKRLEQKKLKDMTTKAKSKRTKTSRRVNL